mgnify:FL=1
MFTAAVLTAVIIFEVVKILLYKTFTLSDAALQIVLTIFSIAYVVFASKFDKPILENVLSAILCFAHASSLAIALFYFVEQTRMYLAYNKKLSKFLKDTEYDFFIQVNKKNKIKDYGVALLKTVGLTKKEVVKKDVWHLLFDTLEIQTINKLDATTSNFNDFVNEYENSTSKFKTYNFEMGIVLKEHKVTYKGIIEPIYMGNHLIGRNIYFYIDRIKNIQMLKDELNSAIHDLERLRNQNFAMMSLADGVLLYFDYETKYYVATESFCRFTNTHQREYTFEEIINFIHPDDLESYIEQSETINSVSVTRLKFRLLINDTYYNVMEDSIYLSGETDLVSIIRICEKNEEGSENAMFSTYEATKIIETLSTTNIESVIEKTKNILDTVVGDDTDE